MLTAEELASLPYAPNPFSQGITASDFKGNLYSPHGAPLRWWKAWEVPHGVSGPNGEARERNGRVYVEQTVGSDVRVLLYRTNRQMFDSEFGLIEKGSQGMSTIPDEIELARLDRVSFPLVSWLAREIVKADGSASLPLGRRPVVDVVRVQMIQGGQLGEVPSARYAVTPDGLIWAPGQLPSAESLLSLEYHFSPTWEWIGEEQGIVQRGSDGRRLPQRGTLRLLRKGEGDGD